MLSAASEATYTTYSDAGDCAVVLAGLKKEKTIVVAHSATRADVRFANGVTVPIIVAEI
jgi:hypothetical protein